MWILDIPDISKAFNEDVDELVKHCRNLSTHDGDLLKKLYKKYNICKGKVNAVDLNPLSSKKNIIRDQYISKIKEKGTLSFIRKDLLREVSKCPFCGINEPVTLDHYMDKSLYGQLACCRLNLIPSCWKCNHTKAKKTYSDFVHAYYDRFDYGKFFFVTTIKIKKNKFVMDFCIDKGAISNKDLADRTASQFDNLLLCKRYRKEATKFLLDYVKTLICSSEKSLKQMLKKTHKDYIKKYGGNHWKTSVIRGLINCNSFNLSVVQNIQKHKVRMENGIGA